MLRRHGEGVFGWARFQPDRGYEFNGTALVCGDAAGTVLLVDPVPASSGDLEALRGLGRRFVVVLLNADHERDAARLAEALSAEVRAPMPDVPLLKAGGARPFDDGAVFEGGFVARILSGMKTPGEAVLHHPERRLLVVGDSVIADPNTGLRLVPPAKIPDRKTALASLQQLMELDFDALLTGDGFVLPSGGRDALGRFLESAR